MLISVLFVFWLTGNHLEYRWYPMPDEATCWELLPKINSHDVPDNATLTCIQLRKDTAT